MIGGWGIGWSYVAEPAENPRVGGSTPSQATNSNVPPDELTRGDPSASEAETLLTLAVLLALCLMEHAILRHAILTVTVTPEGG